ncbi:hypothetical protein DFS34DRAFT_647071 [Phlyctochytrium arcticum]|nr:hypothetical protein DFS34DRAFT_647071 [Phlyctochytrium arcticum]
MDKKTQKYDRQLRLWQAHGQAALESAQVCLLKGTAVGAEVLKNLILPGIGSFIVVDDKKVEMSDFGNNFFIGREMLDQSRAKAIVESLKELNPDVQGSFLEENPTALVMKNRHFLEKFSLIIATQLEEAVVKELASICEQANIPLVIIRVSGLYTYGRIVIAEHTVVETHPEQNVDLRLDCPFPSLRAFSESYGELQTLDSMTHSHVPYPVILLKCLNDFKRSHQGSLPSTSEERAQFKDLIRAAGQHDGTSDNQNFDEALAAAYRAWSPTKIAPSIREILSDPKTKQINPQTPDFWVIAAAVAHFVENEGDGYLPLAGIVPDMHADTESFVRLQMAYREKAQEDIASVKKRIIEISSAANFDAKVSDEDIERFCKNVAHLKVIRYRSIQDEFNPDTAKKAQMAGWLTDSESEFFIYVLMRASDLFLAKHGRYPGSTADWSADTLPLRESVVEILSRWGVNFEHTALSEDDIIEWVRTGASELHSVAALHGGVMAQEIIKLLTHQYVPLSNTLVFNGVKSTAAVFEL